MTPRQRAAALNQRGIDFERCGEWTQAARLYKRAAVTDPDWAAPPFNLGLLYKRRRNWQKSLVWNRKATRIDPADGAGWWNLGIAATALRRWKLARTAWRGFGIELPDGNGPIDFPCGFGPVRLDPDGDAEVVWAQRIDPARAVLVSIPFPESGHRWRDVVLTDGAPVGYRRYRGQEVPVFDVLQRLQPSRFGTFIARVRLPANSNKAERLASLAAEMGGSAEDWSTSVRILCRACSEGRPHKHHDSNRVPPPPPEVRLIGIAARGRRHATRILNAWEAEAKRGIRVESLSDDATAS